MELFGDSDATKNGMLDTLLAMIESGEIAHARTQAELLAAIDEILDADRVTGEAAPTSPPKTSRPASSAASPGPPAGSRRQGKPPAEHPDGRPPTYTLNRPSAAFRVRTRVSV